MMMVMVMTIMMTMMLVMVMVMMLVVAMTIMMVMMVFWSRSEWMAIFCRNQINILSKRITLIIQRNGNGEELDVYRLYREKKLILGIGIVCNGGINIYETKMDISKFLNECSPCWHC